jgi:hypothetical protein
VSLAFFTRVWARVFAQPRHSEKGTHMELTYENVSRWFDVYFEDVHKNQGDLETVPNLKKYFAPDLELMMYTSPASPPAALMSRDALLVSFVHPGLFEEIIPKCYAIDLRQMMVVVQFEIRFSDDPSGKTWAPLQASAHYHLVVDENEDLKIRRIHYWTETLPVDLFEIWARHREEALTGLAINYINSKMQNP